MDRTAALSCAQLLVGVLGQQPTTVCLQHTYRMIGRLFPDTLPTSKHVLLTWAAINDNLFKHGGFIPFDVYEEFVTKYGEEVARLVVSFDNLFITGQCNSSLNTTPRTQPLNDSVQLLIRALDEEGTDDERSLSKIIKLCNEQNMPGHATQDFNDIDVITWWAGGARMPGEMVNVMGPAAGAGQAAGLGNPAMVLAPQMLRQASPLPSLQQPLQQQQHSALMALGQQAQQGRRSPTMGMVFPPSSYHPATPLNAAIPHPAPSAAASTAMQQQQPSATPAVPQQQHDEQGTSLPPRPPLTSAMVAANNSHSQRHMTSHNNQRAVSPPASLPSVEEQIGLAPGIAMLYELWLARGQGFKNTKVASLMQSVRVALDGIWAIKDPEIAKVAKSQVPKQLRQLLEKQGFKRGAAHVDESWDHFLHFLEVKTQTVISKELKDCLIKELGKGAAGRLTVAEQLLPEVAIDYVKPLTKVEDLRAYCEIHEQELHALVDLLHRGSGVFKAALQQMLDYVKRKDVRGGGGGSSMMDVCREEGQ